MLLTHFLRHVSQLIKQGNKKKSKKCVRVLEILKDVIINKEIDGKVEVYGTQLRSEYMKLMN